MDKQNRQMSIQSDQDELSVAGAGPCPLGEASLGRSARTREGHTWNHAQASLKVIAGSRLGQLPSPQTLAIL